MCMIFFTCNFKNTKGNIHICALPLSFYAMLFFLGAFSIYIKSSRIKFVFVLFLFNRDERITEQLVH